MKSFLRRFATDAFATLFGVLAVVFALVADRYGSRVLFVLSVIMGLIYLTLLLLSIPRSSTLTQKGRTE